MPKAYYTDKYRLTGKWSLVVSAYDDYKSGKKSMFSTLDEICQAYKVHRKDVYKYYERWLRSGKNQDSLLPQKRGPKPGQLKILSKDEERMILKINRRLGANEFEIFEMIGEHKMTNGNSAFKIHPSASTIYRTFKRYPLNKKRKEKIKRYEKMYPGELIHVDTMVLNKTVFAERNRYYLVGFLDDCTRLCYTALIQKQTAVEAAREFLNGYKWFHAHGIKIEEILSDNGSEFTSFTSKNDSKDHFFETMISLFGVKHKYTRPYRPQTNGKIERFWKLLKSECIRLLPKSPTRQEFIEELAGFMYRYNYQRRHGGLNYKTPLDKLRYVTEIMK